MLSITTSINLLCLGACILATAYHSVLYTYYRDKLLLHYVLYLAFMSVFIFIRSDLYGLLFGQPAADKTHFLFNEGLQVIYFTLYINFGAHAVEVPRIKGSFVYKGWVFLSFVLLGYATSVILLHANNIVLPVHFFVAIRIFILAMSCVLLWRTYMLKVSVFQRWILWGCIYFLVCGLMSFITNIIPGQQLIFYPLEWLQIGNFGEILFFSSAMGYRLKKVNDERTLALNQAQQLRFEKTNAVIQTRLEERNRIAHDMHDDLGSGLTKIAILSEVAKTQLMQPEKARVQLESIAVSSRELVDSLQDIIWILNPKNDTLESLASYIREYALKFFEPTETVAVFDYPDEIVDTKLTEEQRRNLFLAVKETLNNTAKYAQAGKLNILLSQTNEKIRFVITDDGKGFDVNNTRSFGNGLQNMQERMKRANGVFLINSEYGKGTVVTLEISLEFRV
ncbi:sensor histidine kinase [Ferruginibacter sp. HRS2-29]|uniref:sensor histidine kinase n=1 Tax=Ferruginibacter sp. HRS2-29 TaxID=2487334 RepID=UPI0020CCD99C|nr:sensor histidine kinase [Ferruginibacter sp. HRS2-29]MCP9751691.1 sensor histidine kinase [Ferruginibacter sp. HRS2-29]